MLEVQYLDQDDTDAKQENQCFGEDTDEKTSHKSLHGVTEQSIVVDLILPYLPDSPLKAV